MTYINKTLLIILPLLLMLVFITACKQVPEDESVRLQVDPADQVCQTDSDCMMTMVQCSCDCGVSINKTHANKYEELLDTQCANYQGVYCKLDCDIETQCENNKCVAIETATDTEESFCSTDSDCVNISTKTSCFQNCQDHPDGCEGAPQCAVVNRNVIQPDCMVSKPCREPISIQCVNKQCVSEE
ncbi:hypothetical protein ACFL2B_00200 [Patescibacteria group bacterium]